MKQYLQDRIIAGAGLALTAVFWRLTGEYPDDSALFPQVCLVGIALLLVLLGVESVQTERKLKATGKEGQKAASMNWGPFGLVTGALAAYGAGLIVLGFYSASALFLLAVGFFWGGVKKPVILIFTVIFLVFLFVCFTVLFNVPLPAGIAR